MWRAWKEERCIQDYGGIMGKSEVKSLFKRPRRRCEDDI
jgi:hypothetical protein